MKKGLVVLTLLFVFCLVLTGCKKKEDNKGGEATSGGWTTEITKRRYEIHGSVLEAFNNAKANYKDMNLEPIEVLGQQVVSGTNYLFLATNTEDSSKYKIVVVYKDLKGNSSITSVKDFDYSKYVSKNIDYKDEELSGGWSAPEPKPPLNLENEKYQNVFSKATSEITGIYYDPIAVVAKQIVSGTNYAVLCSGKTVTETPKEYLFLLTIYEDLEGNVTLSSVANIDLADLV